MAGELVRGQEADDADKSPPHPGIPGDEDLFLGTPGSDDPHLHAPKCFGNPL